MVGVGEEGGVRGRVRHCGGAGGDRWYGRVKGVGGNGVEDLGRAKGNRAE